MKNNQKAHSKKETVECLACDEIIFIGKNPKIGNFVTCHHCDAIFQIIDIEPILIDWPYDEDDFTDDDEGYFDDDDDNEDYDDYDDDDDS